MISTNELKFLLNLLGCPDYRTRLNDKRFNNFTGKGKLCLDLADRGWLDFTREIATAKLLPAGSALLTLDPEQLPIDARSLKVLAAIAKSATAIKASSIRTRKAAMQSE
jgi:hypothetical protein